MHWQQRGSPVRTNFKQTLLVRKVMCTVFWDRKGILLIDFLPRGETVLCSTMTMLVTHTSRRTAAILTEFVWKFFDHSPYSPDISTSDINVFLYLKKFLFPVTEFDCPRIITSTIARLRTEHLKGMKIHPDKTRSYVQCKHCPDLQLTPNHILECPTVATKLLKMGMVPLRDSLRELLYSPDAPRIAEAVIRTFDGI
ncbi:uncharacterized protein TNCV_2592741 [Trichonephila clavipes]|nr:uncharacterized protein TNCV_2592741 [Trichonephila clavipes]